MLSRARAQLGIGAAWYEREHDGLGVPFPPVAERFERFEETLQAWVGSREPDLPAFVARIGEQVVPRLREL